LCHRIEHLIRLTGQDLDVCYELAVKLERYERKIIRENLSA
jgi:hypothetical protein